MAAPNIPPIEGTETPRTVEASTVREAVEIATQQIEAGEPVAVVVTEEIPEENEATWRKKTQALLNELKKLLTEHRNDQTETRAVITRMEDQLKLVISSSPNRPSASSESSPISETPPQSLPIVEPAPATPRNDGEDHQEAPTPPPRKRRKI